MKLYEAFFLSFITSLLAGALLFIGLPLVWGFIALEDKISFIDSELTIIVLILYAIYVIIQFLLSGIHLIQAIYFENKGLLKFDDASILRHFLIAELALYIVVFVIFSMLIWEPHAILFILAFSIPYAICCTNSVFIFGYFLKKLTRNNKSS